MVKEQIENVKICLDHIISITAILGALTGSTDLKDSKFGRLDLINNLSRMTTFAHLVLSTNYMSVTLTIFKITDQWHYYCHSNQLVALFLCWFFQYFMFPLLLITGKENRTSLI